MMERVETMCRLLSDAGFDDTVVDIFRENKVDQQVLISLDKEDMLELGVVALGDRKRLQQLIVSLRDVEKENVCPGGGGDRGSKDRRKDRRKEETSTVPTCTPRSPLSSPLSSSSYELSDVPGSHKDLENFMEEDILQPHSAENLAGEELEESLLSHEEEVDTQNSTVVDASQKLNQGPSVQASITSNVPDYLEGWEEDFTAPTQFSERTMGVLSSGLMSKSARAEITQATTAKMLNFCKYPTADQYNIVAKKIVTNLLNGKKDSTGTGFGSWAKGLETRFRNIRRKPRSSIGLEFSPPTKKKKIGIHSCPQSSALLDDATYDLHLKELERQLSKKTKSKSALSSLMAETSANRHKWIVDKKPSVLEVIKKFPTLKTFDMLLVDFASITVMEDPMKSFMANWKIWIPKIYQKVKLEAGLHRKTYLSFLPLISQYEDKSVEDICEDPDILVLLLCLRKLLNSKMPKKCTEFLVFLEDGDDIDKKVEEITENAPYMVQVGSVTTRQWFIAIEKGILFSVDNFAKAVVAMMACYYVFDIAYPKQWNSCLLFIAKYLLTPKGCPSLNATQLGIIADIENI